MCTAETVSKKKRSFKNNYIRVLIIIIILKLSPDHVHV